MTSKPIRGFRTKPVQDGTARVKVERIPYFGGSASDKIRRKKSKRVTVKPMGLKALFTPVKGD